MDIQTHASFSIYSFIYLSFELFSCPGFKWGVWPSFCSSGSGCFQQPSSPAFCRSIVTPCVSVSRGSLGSCLCVIVCVRFTHWLWSCSSITVAAALGSRRYWPSPQSLLANSCFILWQFALMKSRRSPSDLCSLSIFNHVILIWGMS